MKQQQSVIKFSGSVKAMLKLYLTQYPPTHTLCLCLTHNKQETIPLLWWELKKYQRGCDRSDSSSRLDEADFDWLQPAGKEIPLKH